MDKRSKYEVSTPLDDVPRTCVDIVQAKVCPEIEMVQGEITHLLRTARHDRDPSIEGVIWHIDQARRRLITLDAHLEDISRLALSYKAYAGSLHEDTEALRNKVQEKMEAVASHYASAADLPMQNEKPSEEESKDGQE